MERYIENIQSKKDQNLMSFVLMVCSLMMIFSFWGAFSSDHKVAQNTDETDRVLVVLSK